MNLTSQTLAKSFTTERLLISQSEPSDADQLFDAAVESVSEVYPFLPWCHPEYCLSESKDWLTQTVSEWQSGNLYAFTIRHGETGKFIGGCGLNRIDINPIANLGYWIRTSETNKGYATEATLGLIKYGFQQLGLLRIEIIMSIENQASRTVAINAGSLLEGTLKNRLLLHGEPHDTYLYALTPKIITGL